MSLTVPGASAGDDVLNEWSLLNPTVAGTPPNVSVVGSAKSVPKTPMLVPPAAGPDLVSIAKMMRCEISDVLPFGSVAVAEMRTPSSVPTGRGMAKLTCPEASVDTGAEPRYVRPWRNSLGKFEQAGSA